MPAAPALTLPIWFQALLGVIAILGFLGGAWFALFIIWPSIRRQDRRADQIEQWMESDEAKSIRTAILGKLSISGKSTTRQDFSGTFGKDYPPRSREANDL
jgi:uncharacterized membrane protein